jgi:hypothetical protein
MKQYIADLVLYIVMFGIAYFYLYGEHDLFLTVLAALSLIGLFNIVNSIFSLIGHGFFWCWQQLMIIRKNND